MTEGDYAQVKTGQVVENADEGEKVQDEWGESGGEYVMERWKQMMARSCRGAAGLEAVTRVFPMCLSPHVLELIRRGSEAIRRQFMPDVAELEESGDLQPDPLAEERLSPVPNIVHKYPDHCLFLVSDACAAYCRFCTRKRKFGAGRGIDPTKLEPGFAYIERHAEIRDVLVSGGDPLLLEDGRLEEILRRLRKIRHLEIIRLGTRVPFSLPERVTRKLARMLGRYHPLYVNVHVNHPDELDAKTVGALGRLADAGIPLGSQTVLLKGVNDSVEVMRTLMTKLLAARVRPYYLFQSDLVFGNEHFRTPLRQGLEIMRGLRCWISGLGVPAFIIDLPNGGGKVQLVPESLVRREGRRWTFLNYRGQEYVYPDVGEEDED